MEGYPFREVEARQRQRWEASGVDCVDIYKFEHKFYVLVMFSYPSEKKLHIGHWWNYGPADTFARFKRLQGYNVFEPMGFDAFGLPAENYAIRHKVHPAVTTRDSVNFIREQLKQIGAIYDWNFEVDTSQPIYYKWTQWLFLQLYKHGAAYRKRAPVNWCPSCQTVLANEQVLSNGTCERCKEAVTTRDLEQWFFRITDFANRLLEGLERIDWPESTKAMQRHWIGRSEGSEIIFPLEDGSDNIRCFTTRADTLFGVTYVVLAPENELVQHITTKEQRAEVMQYIKQARETSEIERLSTERVKTGVFSGAYARHPLTGARLPIWIADYVLGTYGTGAVMAVPAHDQRDFEFACKYNLPVKWVIKPLNPHDDVFIDRAFEDYGIMVDSARFNGMTSEQGRGAVTEYLHSLGLGSYEVSYRLRDWLISRQRYWGAPIPMIHCEKCRIVPVLEADLPVLLPEDIVDFTPRGASPLGAHKAFMDVKCPQCGGEARRDPDTMDTFVDSSWYFLRYLSAKSDDKPFDAELVSKWLPVNVYVGGPEHATGHLIYARFITMFLNSIGLIPFDEPFKRLVHQGIITCNGARMSKSVGNVVNPDAFIEKYGSDCFRLYLMFMGDYTVGGDWSDEGIVGVKRFQNRIWRLFQTWLPELPLNRDKLQSVDRNLNRVLNFTIKEVTSDLEQFQFNTAISRLMELTNELYEYCRYPTKIDRVFLKETLETLTILLAPFAPHLAEELWEGFGHKDSIMQQKWPAYNEAALMLDEATVALQINGKFIDTIVLEKDLAQPQAVEIALEHPKIKRALRGKSLKKTIYVPNKILNFVVPAL
ncbi:MAG: leucine--tRNA ligase [Calditrichaeota bacterium]|nr:leucine--tRNA ligase [Calditrichota bacterium]